MPCPSQGFFIAQKIAQKSVDYWPPATHKRIIKSSLSTTMQQTDIQWSSEEKRIALAALKKSYENEVNELIKTVRENAGSISQLEEVWQLHDFLSAKRHEIDGRYDDRESFLMFTLSQLVKDGRLEMAELEELSSEKKAKVRVLSRM